MSFWVTPLLWLYLPVSRLARDGPHNGVETMAFSNSQALVGEAGQLRRAGRAVHMRPG